MNALQLKNGKKYSLHGALVAAFGYAVLALTSGPALAAACDCDYWRAWAEVKCEPGGAPGEGGVFIFECDETHYYVECLVDHFPDEGTC